MKNDISLINLGAFADTATTLVNRISDAVGGIFKPTQIRRIAEAEAYAMKVQMLAQIETTDIEQRAISRMINEEAEKQKNIESVTVKALPLLTESASPEKIERDWLVAFFDKARIVSNEEMQELWARVLAGEANSPGAFSKRTLQVLAALDKSDADMFSSLCNFTWNIDGQVPLVLDSAEKLYTDNGVNFETLLHLESIGLISFDGLAGFTFVTDENMCSVSYLEKTMNLTLKKRTRSSKYELPIGQCVFTNAGLELLKMCQPVKKSEFLEYVIREWEEEGIQISPTSANG